MVSKMANRYGAGGRSRPSIHWNVFQNFLVKLRLNVGDLVLAVVRVHPLVTPLKATREGEMTVVK